MAVISRGQITIVDLSDGKSINLYLGSNVALTQIYNKITTEHLVSLELQEGRNHALIVVDLDKFKYATIRSGTCSGTR